MAFPRQPFSLFFFESIFEPCPGRPKSDDQMGWASVNFFGAWAWWMAFGSFLFMFCLPWIIGLVGLWTPSRSLRCWTRSTVN